MNKILHIFFLVLLFLLKIKAAENNHVNPDITNLNSEELQSYIENNEIVIVGFIDNLEAKEYGYIQGLYLSLKEHKSLKFTITSDSNSNVWASEKIGVQVENPSIVIFKQGNGYHIPFDKVQSKAMFNVRTLCLKALKPYIDELDSMVNDFNYDYLLYYYADEEDKIAKFDLMQQLAINLFQEFNVKYINLERNPLNLNLPELKSKFIIVTKNIQSYYRQFDVLSENDETNFENISYFVKYYQSGALNPQFLWRAEEMNWDFTNYVTEARPNIYESIVLNPKNDVIVLYYKADCPYSQQVMESFQDLAKRYIDQRHKLTVAEFEAENQNIPNVSPWRNLIEYPTIVLYPASKNGPKRQFYVMKQNLGRSAINIANWMLKRVNNSYDEVTYSSDDYQKLTDIDGGYIQQDEKEETEEIRSVRLLDDPNLIYTIFGQGRDQKFYSIKDEENNYYIGNTDYKELPLTAVYYELTPTTYIVHRPEPTTNPAKELARKKAIENRKKEN
jgi:thiol-disulfide isomerase/thioredoxin